MITFEYTNTILAIVLLRTMGSKSMTTQKSVKNCLIRREHQNQLKALVTAKNVMMDDKFVDDNHVMMDDKFNGNMDDNRFNQHMIDPSWIEEINYSVYIDHTLVNLKKKNAKCCFPKPFFKMQTLGFLFYIGLLFIFYTSPFSTASTKIQYPVSRRGLTTMRKPDMDPDPNRLLDDIKVEVDPSLKFESPRIKKAYFALQEWKKVLISDPLNMTVNWVGPDVCSYFGVICVPALDDERVTTVAGIDLNFGDISGQLVPHLGLLTDLGILHLHSNRMCGVIPKTFSNLQLLYELDLSDNRFSGVFPSLVLSLSSLRFLDIRFNEFEGPLPPELFEMDLDAIIVNNNRLSSHIPKNIGNSPASILVLSNNKFSGCIPRSIGRMQYLEQVSFSNNRLTGCLPEELALPKFLVAFDVSKNYFMGPLPKSLERSKTIERFDCSHNQLTGKVHDNVCSLPELWNMTIHNNFFNEIGGECEKLFNDEKLILGDSDNCFSKKPNQRSPKDCLPVLSHPVDCKTIGCQPRDPMIIALMKRKTTPPLPTLHSPSPPTKPTLVPHPPKVTPPSPPKPPPAASQTPARMFKNLSPKIGSQHSSPPSPLVFQGH
ncbi:hypothetical protein QVD17_26600 [Tagetes erecta]|uniref:Cell wall hydroxyproline-rich glycoprotein n=1 Tax=Tagetes erecta TaxID=13708 RepID=A0AAD8K9C9_TARER|nr:hypothetical protein QVD17_26600 [Tagetes erecta]